ncbi:hypothetical protein J0B02_09325 [Enterobacteriaceae bacterium YMB-R22]|jgi:hypothetical protein|uniref:hypothetical protein n=1 Tax=Tenebrionicola larvae TaxID=2815733 RepID=UPI002013BBE9|nr:hypothetical protein [Tenebrionicola larvae]MBV4413013.1 hypothetical protein [Tenebrionicola larvae]
MHIKDETGAKSAGKRVILPKMTHNKYAGRSPSLIFGLVAAFYQVKQAGLAFKAGNSVATIKVK